MICSFCSRCNAMRAEPPWGRQPTYMCSRVRDIRKYARGDGAFGQEYTTQTGTNARHDRAMCWCVLRAECTMRRLGEPTWQRFFPSLTQGSTMLGVIGGTGLYDLPGLDDVETVDVDTPFGAPSAALVRGTLNGSPVVLLARHGHGHRINPSEIPFQANIYAMKQVGVTHLLSVNAVGSLREDLPPRTAVVPD